jgi:integrase
VYFDERRGVWVAKKIIGRTATGRPKYIERSDRNQADAISKLQEAEPPKPGGTLAEWANAWLAADSSRQRTRAIRGNNMRLHVIPVLGHLPIARITPAQIEQGIQKWLTKMSENTCRTLLNGLHTCFEAAIAAGLASTNPVKGARKPKATRVLVEPFTPSELSRIITEAGKRENTRILAMLAGTGCRVGEALALNVGDFDPARSTVTISRTQHADGTAGPTKSANGVRTIAPPDLTLPILTVEGKPSDPLFPVRHGQRGTHQRTRKVWVRLLHRLELRYRNMHQLRHSVATALISAGVPLGDVAAYLGDTVGSVVRTYLHATGKSPAVTMNKLLDSTEDATKSGEFDPCPSR